MMESNAKNRNKKLNEGTQQRLGKTIQTGNTTIPFPSLASDSFLGNLVPEGHSQTLFAIGHLRLMPRRPKEVQLCRT